MAQLTFTELRNTLDQLVNSSTRNVNLVSRTTKCLSCAQTDLEERSQGISGVD